MDIGLGADQRKNADLQEDLQLFLDLGPSTNIKEEDTDRTGRN